MSTRKVLRTAALIAVYAVSATLVWLVTVVWRSGPLEEVVRHSSTFDGVVLRNDARYGHAPVPGVRGVERRPSGGVAVPVAFDADGLRTPEPWGPISRGARRMLSLGCSFTFGHLVLAEQAWPEVAGRVLGREVKNGGVCGWGLAQMLLRARDLAPTLRPDTILVQHSPWLAQRATSIFGLSQPGLGPAPYFYPRDGSFSLQTPLFASKVLDLDRTPFAGVDPAKFPRARFLREFALPLFLHDDLVRLRVPLGLRTGWIPRPATDLKSVERHVHGELAAIARDIGARLVVVSISYGDPVEPPAREEGVTYVDAMAALYSRLPEPTRETFARDFQHWSNGALVDRHPNVLAHRIIGETVAEAIRAAESGAPPSQTSR